ncbi:Hypothetical_protein [Hexamita inflata]|uniref:Hypothetical_protein n=1 Tax=Hexamita inflata TaxID=28002 RepID=A0AA86RDB4_9EUKA|nr:Hypothetical protein HINF_LOCUS57999 [Hexamita inflata]
MQRTVNKQCNFQTVQAKRHRKLNRRNDEEIQKTLRKPSYSRSFQLKLTTNGQDTAAHRQTCKSRDQRRFGSHPTTGTAAETRTEFKESRGRQDQKELQGITDGTNHAQHPQKVDEIISAFNYPTKEQLRGNAASRHHRLHQQAARQEIAKYRKSGRRKTLKAAADLEKLLQQQQLLTDIQNSEQEGQLIKLQQQISEFGLQQN